MKHYKNKQRISQKQLYLFLSIAFFSMIFFSLFSFYNMKKNIEHDAQTQRYQTNNETLIRTQSDLIRYQTNEVERFVMTHEIRHLDNFLGEKNEVIAREKRINKIKFDDKFNFESKYWNIVEENAGLLYYLQIRAIKLITTSMAIPKEELPEIINNYQLNWVEKQMSTDEMQARAEEILFSNQHNSEQNVVSNNLLKYQNAVLARLNNDSLVSKENTALAMRIQFITQLIIILIFLIILLFFFHYVVGPIQNYTQSLKKSNWTDEKPPLTPQGSIEIYNFAVNFNQIYGQMIRANKVRSEFLSSTSHEIRTPLNAILGYIHLLSQSELNQKQSKQIKIIQRASNHLLKLINNVLDYAKIDQFGIELNPTGFNLEQFFEEIIALHQQSAKDKKINLQLTFPKLSIKQVYADQEKISQVLINLISNAIKFTDNGTVKVVVEEKMLHSITTDKIFLKISVIDEGIGIQPEAIDKIFNNFEQANRLINSQYGGTGLGLPISKKIIEKMGGTLSIDSNLGEGTAFIIELGLKKYIEIKKAASNQHKIHQKTKLQNILLVDDNQLNLEMEKEILQQYDLLIDTATSGNETIEKLNSADYDLVFLDLRLPDISGFEVIKYLRNEMTRNQFVQVIALTAEAEKEVLKKAIDAGMNGFITKPIDINELENLLFTHFKNNTRKSKKNVSSFDYLYQDFFNTYLPKVNALHGNSNEIVLRLFHDLKGLTGNLKMNELYQLTVKTEKKYKETQSITLIHNYQTQFNHFSKLLPTHKNKKDAKQILNANNKKRLAEMIEQSNPLALDYFSRFRNSTKLENELKQALMDYHFSLASELLEKIEV